MSIYVFQFMFTVFTLRIVAALTQFFVNFCRLHYVISRFFEKRLVRSYGLSSNLFRCRSNTIYWR